MSCPFHIGQPVMTKDTQTYIGRVYDPPDHAGPDALMGILVDMTVVHDSTMYDLVNLVASELTDDMSHLPEVAFDDEEG